MSMESSSLRANNNIVDECAAINGFLEQMTRDIANSADKFRAAMHKATPSDIDSIMRDPLFGMASVSATGNFLQLMMFLRQFQRSGATIESRTLSAMAALQRRIKTYNEYAESRRNEIFATILENELVNAFKREEKERKARATPTNIPDAVRQLFAQFDAGSYVQFPGEWPQDTPPPEQVAPKAEKQPEVEEKLPIQHLSKDMTFLLSLQLHSDEAIGLTSTHYKAVIDFIDQVGYLQTADFDDPHAGKGYRHIMTKLGVFMEDRADGFMPARAALLPNPSLTASRQEVRRRVLKILDYAVGFYMGLKNKLSEKE